MKQETRKYPTPSNIFSVRRGKNMEHSCNAQRKEMSLQIAQMNRCTYSIALGP